MLRKQLLDTSRGRIITLLQHQVQLTVDEIAARLGVSVSAVRSQMTAMERDSVIRRVGQRRGTTRPSQLFELTPEVEHLLSQAYVPFLAQLIDVFTEHVSADQLTGLLVDTGKRLAEQLLAGKKPTGTIETRVRAVSDLMNDQLGALTHVESNGGYVIHGTGCPLAAVTGKHPAVCLAMEQLVSEVVGVPVHECCERSGRPRCCFKIEAATPPAKGN